MRRFAPAEPRSSPTWPAPARSPLPHRLARWGAQIIGYVRNRRAPAPLPHRLARWGAQIIGYVRTAPRALAAPPSARPMGSADHWLRASPCVVRPRSWRPRPSAGCVEALGLGRRMPGSAHVADDLLPPGDKHRGAVARAPLPHRLARWGAQIIGYALRSDILRMAAIPYSPNVPA